MREILKVDELSINFETRNGILKAVERISFSIEEGETLGIVGESGCGKSLTNLSLMGLLPVNAKVNFKEVSFLGKSINNISEKKMQKIRGKKISMIFQNSLSSLNPSFKIGKQIDEIIKFSGESISKSKRFDKIIETLNLVGIPNPIERYNSYPHEFSGGMAQRVMIAMAIINSPDLLIADEPTTALDVTIQKQILDLLKKIQNETKMSLILVTHDLSVVEYMCNNLLVMYAGIIVESGRTKDIINFPKHPYTIGLINSKPKFSKLNQKAPLPSIRGIVPTLKQKKKGCYFSPRCDYASDICTKEAPEEFLGTQKVLCHNLDKIL